jgi:shikimate dehydrogenase
MTRLLLLLGDPVHHSLSPSMHNAAIRELGLPFVYVASRVRSGLIGDAVSGIRALGVAGANVTIPHKEHVIEHLDMLTPTAEAVGAVNTIFWKGNLLVGDNTDVEGFLRPLSDLERSFQSALVLGSGGAARAVTYGLRDVPGLTIAARSEDKAARMVRELSISAEVVPLEKAGEHATRADLIVNATPVGGPESEHLVPIVLRNLSPGVVVYDLLYSPSPTRFLSHAANLGATVLDGRRMLREQASAAFERWTGHRFPTSVLVN